MRAAIWILSTFCCCSWAAPPSRMLWCWISETDVRFLKPEQAGIAFHAASLHISGRTEVVPAVRRAALRSAPGVFEMPVVRIEFDPDSAFSSRQRDLAAGMIVATATVTKARAIQIDFDAPKRARPFYRNLIRQVRGRLGRHVFLSITALASWCGTPSWLAGLEVDETVPMMFRMGPSDATVSDDGCRGSIGVSTREAAVPVKSGQRVYLFPDHEPWTPQTVAAAFRRFGL